VLVGVVVLAGGFLLRTRKRKAVVLALIGIAALIIGVAVDIAIPALAGALLLYRGAPREKAPR
jgi:hydrogenase/urease accessory protein HupE